MAGLSDQEIEAIAQHIVADLTGDGGRRGAGHAERPVGPSLAGELGIFDSIDEAVRAARAAFGQFDEMGLQKRNAIIAAIRDAMREHGERAGPRSARGDRAGPLRRQGPQEPARHREDPGHRGPAAAGRSPAITASTSPSRRPYGVIAAITPTTNPTSTIINNTIGMLAAGNAVVFNVHPNARRVSCHNVALINKAIVAAGGPRNLITCIANPTVESAQALMKHPGIRLVVVTGGGGVVQGGDGQRQARHLRRARQPARRGG